MATLYPGEDPPFAVGDRVALTGSPYDGLHGTVVALAVRGWPAHVRIDSVTCGPRPTGPPGTWPCFSGMAIAESL